MSTATLSVDTVRAIDDVEDRAREAARIVQHAETKAQEDRAKRDSAAVTVVHAEGELPIRVAELADISRGLMFRLLDDERLGGLVAAEVALLPSEPDNDAFREIANRLGVTKVNPRTGETVLDVARVRRLALSRPIVDSTMADPRAVLRAAAKGLRKWERLRDDGRDVRDEAIDKMLASPTWRNADVARMTGLTTARVAQMRHGTR